MLVHFELKIINFKQKNNYLGSDTVWKSVKMLDSNDSFVDFLHHICAADI